MEQAIVSCLGYTAIMAGCMFEGETIVIAAGLAAHAGLLSLPLVFLCAWIGAVTGDHFFFMLGRYKGRQVLGLRPSWENKSRRAFGLIEKHGSMLIFGSRFLYGFRALGPFTIGAARVEISRFTSLNLISAIVWTCFFGFAGYFSKAAIGIGPTYGRLSLTLLAVILIIAVVARYRRAIIFRVSMALKGMQTYYLLSGRFLRTVGLSHGRHV